MDYPLLYIQTPPPARRIEEESTSIYVKKEPVPSLIMHQLRYFSRRTNKDRQLYFQLKNGEHLVGTIEKLKGEEVLVSAKHISKGEYGSACRAPKRILADLGLCNIEIVFFLIFDFRSYFIPWNGIEFPLSMSF